MAEKVTHQYRVALRRDGSDVNVTNGPSFEKALALMMQVTADGKYADGDIVTTLRVLSEDGYEITIDRYELKPAEPEPPALLVGERGMPKCPHCQRDDVRLHAKNTGTWGEKMSWAGGSWGETWEYQSDWEDATSTEHFCWECEQPVTIPEEFE